MDDDDDIHIIKNTPLIVVDKFPYTKMAEYFKSKAEPNKEIDKIYFLTHFHADHYTKINKYFNKHVFTSIITKKLLTNIIGVDETYVHDLKINTYYHFFNFEMIFIDANHCPGSVIIYFRFTNGIIIIHTGDFRFSNVQTRLIKYLLCDSSCAVKRKCTDTVEDVLIGECCNSTGDSSTGNNSTGDSSTGNNSTGDSSTGNNSTGDSSTGNNNTGNNTNGNNTNGNNTNGNNTNGNNTNGDSTNGDSTNGDSTNGTLTKQNKPIYLNNKKYSICHVDTNFNIYNSNTYIVSVDEYRLIYLQHVESMLSKIKQMKNEFYIYKCIEETNYFNYVIFVDVCLYFNQNNIDVLVLYDSDTSTTLDSNNMFYVDNGNVQLNNDILINEKNVKNIRFVLNDKKKDETLKRKRADCDTLCLTKKEDAVTCLDSIENGNCYDSIKSEPEKKIHIKKCKEENKCSSFGYQKIKRQKIKTIKSELLEENEHKKENSENSTQGINHTEDITNIQSINSNEDITNIRGINSNEDITNIQSINSNKDITNIRGINSNEDITNIQGINSNEDITNIQSINSNEDITNIRGINSNEDITNIRGINSNEYITNIQGINSNEDIINIQATNDTICAKKTEETSNYIKTIYLDTTYALHKNNIFGPQFYIINFVIYLCKDKLKKNADMINTSNKNSFKSRATKKVKKEEKITLTKGDGSSGGNNNGSNGGTEKKIIKIIEFITTEDNAKSFANCKDNIRTIKMENVNKSSEIKKKPILLHNSSLTAPSTDLVPVERIKKTLFMFGTYNLGKEKLYLSVSEACDMKIYFKSTKKKDMLMSYLCNKNILNRITDNKLEAQIHIVDINYSSIFPKIEKEKFLNLIDEEIEKEFDDFFYFIPTGWIKKYAMYEHNDITVCLIPYSEHSNLNELKLFIKNTKPCNIVPTVFDNIKKKKEILNIFHPYLNLKMETIQFFKKKKKNSLEIKNRKVTKELAPLKVAAHPKKKKKKIKTKCEKIVMDKNQQKLTLLFPLYKKESKILKL
ncbi:DNA repair metallo-beta-lactamase protein, putative [Hepatocystis sp. ex Piliocolobus tephrosceles]|nr:DNA repair metallo-beta-lactamase protein, putative [Hepatocystis sp. ex Piliocolobus tephrosceles]